MITNKIPRCEICDQIFFDSKKRLKPYMDQNHGIATDDDEDDDDYETVTSGHAERTVDDFLSSTDGVLVISARDSRGRMLAIWFVNSFEKTFSGVTKLADYNYGGSLAIASFGLANGVRDIFGAPRAIITNHKEYKLMLLSMPAFDILVRLILESWVTADDGKIATKIERLVADTLEVTHCDF